MARERKPTVNEIVDNLLIITKNRRERMENLKRMLDSGVPSKDKEWMEKEIGEHEKWLSETERSMKNFSKSYYAPATR